MNATHEELIAFIKNARELAQDRQDAEAIAELIGDYCAGLIGEPTDAALPQCILAMQCYCAGHARGNPASDPCDTRETNA